MVILWDSLNALSLSLSLSLSLLGSVWLGGWKSERIENEEGMERWRDRKDFNFPRLYLVGGRKSGGMENRVCINLLSCPYYITYFI